MDYIDEQETFLRNVRLATIETIRNGLADMTESRVFTSVELSKLADIATVALKLLEVALLEPDVEQADAAARSANKNLEHLRLELDRSKKKDVWVAWCETMLLKVGLHTRPRRM